MAISRQGVALFIVLLAAIVGCGGGSTSSVPSAATTFNIAPTSISFVGDMGPQSGSLGLAATTITGATISGPISPAITVTVLDAGSHMTLSLDNGTTKSTSLVLHSSSDVANAKYYYDGNGPVGYSATVGAIGSAGGYESLNAMTVSAAPGYAGLVLSIVATHNATFTVSEANFIGTFKSANTCTNAAVVSPLVQSVTSATFTVTGGLTTANCTITLSDGTLTYPVINVQNALLGATPVPLPTGTTGGGVSPSSSPLPLPT